ncbi:phage tail sheath C-terminal domain-containing protein [Pseudomonas sp. HR96]|uniref:phage tail sheath C-terminal domain-containing protein n=1 Tax=Pseudomonas sp. HR96 TaxID=1027966 RepID=UPI002A758794|nr:phage tail sheath C-terminal domain-containing protein [Pseudomonas sp. HR96]WPO98645.1 phage tail sheath C-terminal domain-containing protein [Pseudomonas sp. HR96]
MAHARQVVAKRTAVTLPALSAQAPLVAPEDIEADAEFGSSLQISADGSVLVIGARESNRVSVYVSDEGDWRPHSELNCAEGTEFGATVAVNRNGSLIAVGAHIGAEEAGAVYVYRRRGEAWSLLATLSQDETGDGFGAALSMASDGLTLAVGAPQALGTKGAFYVYKSIGGNFSASEFEIEGETAGQDFARSVSLNADGTVLAVGHPGANTHDVEQAGRVLVFTKTSGAWTQEGTELLAQQVGHASDPDGFANDLFGYTVALSGVGDRLVVGADGVRGSTSDTYLNYGAVYFFQLAEDGSWAATSAPQVGQHIDRTPHFGRALAITHDGELLLIGAPGAGTTNYSGKYGLAYWCVWGSARTLFTAPTVATLPAHSHFGHAVALSANGECAAVSSTGTMLHIGEPKKPDVSKVYLFGESQPPADEGSDNQSNRTVPGVYALESNQPLLAIPAGVTAIPLFIGVFRDKFGELLSNGSCIEIANFSDFRRRYGPSQSTTVTLTNGVPGVEDTADLGSLALQLYFDNGGGRCYILPLHDQTNPTELAAMVSKIRRCPDITLYVVTERLDTETDKYHPACDALDPLLRNVGDGFLIADSYDGEHRPTTTDQRTAVYYPALETAYSARAADEDIDVVGFESENDERVTLAQVKAQDQDLYETISEALDTHYAEKGVVRLLASAAVAGVYCRTDANLGIWHAPAGPSLNNVRALYPRPKLAVVDKLIENRINRLYDAPGEGVRVWGARTQEAPELPLWLHINVSRLFDAAARDIKRALQVAVFMPNNAITWNTVRNAINAYLYQLWRDGGLRGATSDEAYYVQIGNETMSAEDLLEGRLIVHVGLAALRPVEFIEVVFSQVLQAG